MKKLSYKSAHEELEKILEEIQSPDTDVDKLSGKIKRAGELIKFCKTKLRMAEEETKKIVDEMKGNDTPGSTN
ncbi:MAG: exodeoxyribonuclease VII small subunit [Bacteroidetes bacterium]|nr:exodeoxyribonuclease VII small subunit [Bacteroidota bacterium]